MYTKRMFTSKFAGLNKKDLVSLNKGDIVIEEEGEVKEYENAGIGIASDKIYLIKTKSFGRTALKEIISISEIDPETIEIESARDFDKENTMAGISILAGQGPFTSIKFENTILQFSSDDKNYVLEVSESQKIKKKFQSLSEEDSTKENTDKDAMKVLKKRFAEGEISEEEFKSKRDILQED